MNPRKPSARAVNAVADTLGIDRGRAHVLAGIVAPGRESASEPDIMPPGLRERIRETLSPEDAKRVEAAVEAALRDEPLPDFRRRRAGGA